MRAENGTVVCATTHAGACGSGCTRQGVSRVAESRPQYKGTAPAVLNLDFTLPLLQVQAFPFRTNSSNFDIDQKPELP